MGCDFVFFDSASLLSGNVGAGSVGVSLTEVELNLRHGRHGIESITQFMIDSFGTRQSKDVQNRSSRIMAGNVDVSASTAAATAAIHVEQILDLGSLDGINSLAANTLLLLNMQSSDGVLDSSAPFEGVRTIRDTTFVQNLVGHS